VRKATHVGSCQCCGRVQKLPDGRLSLHGYTKQWGWFEGTCRGSDYRPFEISKDLIERFIAASELAIKGLEADKTALLNPPTTETKAWFHVYVYSERRVGHYEWRQGLVRQTTKMIGGKEFKFLEWHGDSPCKSHNGRDEPNIEKVSSFGLEDDTPLTATASLNARYVRTYIDKAIKNHQDYIAWQRGRIKDWEPKPLAPVNTEADKQKGAAIAALEKAGCIHKTCMRSRSIGWWHPKGWYLGRAAMAALTELKRIEEKSKSKLIGGELREVTSSAVTKPTSDE
jgi:hypothetical protein